MLIVTRRGAYLSPDGLAYVGTARNLVDGNGYTAPPGSPPLSNFPPLYPLVLAAVGAFGPDPLTVARVLNPLLFGATILVAGLLVRRMSGSLVLAVAAQLLVLSGADFLAYHSSALSEPLFLFLTVAGLSVLAASLSRSRPGLVLGGGLLAAAACMTRYLGVTLVLTGAVGLAALARRGRWKGGVAFVLFALAPLAGWLTWVAGEEGEATNRAAVFHAPDLDYAVDGVRSASAWILPVDVPWGARLAAAGLVLAGLAVVARRPRRARRPNRAVRLLALFSAVYLAALVTDRFLFDVTGRLDSRFLLPLHLVAVVVALWVLSRVNFDRNDLVRVSLATVVGFQVAAGAVWISDAASDSSVRPGGFGAPAWAESALVAQVQALPDDATVFTNQADALYFHTGRIARPVPEKAAFLTGEANPNYQAELGAMFDALGPDGLVVYFTAPPARRAFLATPDELAGRLRLETVSEDAIGVLYRRMPIATAGP